MALQARVHNLNQPDPYGPPVFHYPTCAERVAKAEEAVANSQRFAPQRSTGRDSDLGALLVAGAIGYALGAAAQAQRAPTFNEILEGAYEGDRWCLAQLPGMRQQYRQTIRKMETGRWFRADKERRLPSWRHSLQRIEECMSICL